LSTSTPNKIPLIFLFGPTAVGKTDLLLELFCGKAEVISADSIQVYKRLDVGSAKPDKSYLRALPHHLIDIHDYNEPFSVGDFVRSADEAALDIYSRGLIPVISGGTAFYFRNFYFGLPPVKADTSRARFKLTARLEQDGLDPLWQELKQCDSVYAAKIASRDRQRIIRALEVFYTTGKPLSSFTPPDKARDQYRFLVIGLNRPRPELYERINQRVEQMFDRGLTEEVRALVDQGATAEDPAMKAIGYREFFDSQTGEFRVNDQVMAEIQKDTRRYAKRQMTFFRSLPDVTWFSPEKGPEINHFIESFLKNPSFPLT